MNRRLAVLALVLALVAGCAPRPHSPPSERLPVPSAAASADGPNAPVTIVAPREATNIAVAFVRGWARPHLAQPAWLAGIRALVTPGYERLLAVTDPRNVPAHAVTGPEAVRSSTTQELVVDVPTDVGDVRVTVVPIRGHWLVATADLADKS